MPPSDRILLSDALGMKPHHIGCAVKDIRNVSTTYGNALGFTRRTRPIEIASQKVSVCFVELADSFYLEWVQPLEGNTSLTRYFRVGFYHVCFLVDDLDATSMQLVSHEFVPFEPFASEGFGGAQCQFFLSPQDHLIELAQIPAAEFRVFFNANLDGNV